MRPTTIWSAAASFLALGAGFLAIEASFPALGAGALALGAGALEGPTLRASELRTGAAGREGRAERATAWQQGVRYTIEALLDEEAQLLHGAARLDYRNASPDTLRSIYFHLYLNAFRSGSEWARTERRPQYPFATLTDPDHGYERLRAVRLLPGPGAPGDASAPGAPGDASAPAAFATGEGGLELVPVYPHAPDSTVTYVELPRPLPPGGVLTLLLRWDARPSTLCRRQCRDGRHWDLAQWYPRIAVYDAGRWQTRPLYPQGEFYGEFGTYDVTLDLPADQVVGATGVPVAGDPGWRPVTGSPLAEPRYQRDWYGPVPELASLGLLQSDPQPNRKRVRFRAEDVHHFAWSVDPDFRYEGSILPLTEARERPVALHVLYRPGDEEAWGSGVALERTALALTWLEDLFGPYPWPQLTNLHRLEGGGTEFPMVIMDGSAFLGLIVHESAHQYAHGILANNEWAEAWLDEGLASYLTNTFFEQRGNSPWARNLGNAAAFERSGRSQPVSTRSEEFHDFATYGAMAYRKGSAVFYMLRALLGEATFAELLRTYYARYRFRHVDEKAFRAVAEEVSDRELGWFFEQWLHTSATLDYGIDEASTERLPDGRWQTRVVVIREGEAWMPVTLVVDGESRLLERRDRRQVAEIVTAERPSAVELDPLETLLDLNPDNDRIELSAGEI